MTYETLPAIVVGGGVGGLNAAYQLTRRGVAPVVFEARGRTGGLVFGGDLAGVTVDLGAESFAKRSRYARDLCVELGLEVIDPAGHAWIWTDADGGHAFEIPHGVLGIPTDLDDPAVARALTPAGLARARDDLTMGPGGDDLLDMASLVERRLGREVLQRLVTPVAGGVHSAEVSRLAVDVIAPGLRARLREEGSLVRAAAAQRAAAPAGAVVSSVRGGLYRLAEALERRVLEAGGEVWTRMLVTAVERDADHWLVTVDNALPSPEPHRTGPLAGDPVTIRTPLLVVAVDGRAALDLLRPIAELGLRGWELPRGADLASLDLALDHPALDGGPRGSGLLVTPGASGVRAKALTHYSVKWPWTREASDLHVLRVSYGRGPGTAPPGVAEALADASTLLGVGLRPDQVRASHLVRFDNSLPPQTPEHRARVAALTARLDGLPGLGVAGAWFAGTGLAAVLPQAERAVDRLLGGTVAG